MALLDFGRCSAKDSACEATCVSSWGIDGQSGCLGSSSNGLTFASRPANDFIQYANPNRYSDLQSTQDRGMELFKAFRRLFLVRRHETRFSDASRDGIRKTAELLSRLE